jgi:hypothetical protein
VTLAGIFNILTARALLITSRKKEITNMSQKDSPYIDHAGTIIIPFNADQKYHYWNGGQPLSQTLSELNTSKDIWGNHTEKPYPENAA